jgi:HD-like signal output (HDOD) protein
VIRILFVDDDSQILDGIRRSMHVMRGEWQMRFCSDPLLALQDLAKEPADVVVSDMRMPNMEGSEFLAEVKRLYPQTVRILLSGQAESESIIRATRSAHRYLSKPCDAPTLKAAIARTVNLKSVLNDSQLAALVGSVDALPTPPKAYQGLVECLRNPNSAIADAARIIRQDVAMTAKVLKLANSGFFGLREPVQSIDRAVAFVGMEAMSALVLGQELFNNKNPVTIPGFSLEGLGRHSFETAAWARAVALHQQSSTRVADAAFLCGVLHDVGRLVFATRALPSPSAQREGWLSGITMNMKTHHARVGGYLLGLWGFPEAIVEAIVWHHTPSKCEDGGFGLCGLLHVGDYLSHASAPAADEPEGPELEPGYLEGRGLADKLSDWSKTRAQT